MVEGNGVKWRVATSLLGVVDVVRPMVEVDDAEWRVATSLLLLVDVV